MSYSRRGNAGDRAISEAGRMPSLRSERETGERREMQEGRQVSILSRLTSFPARLAAGRACVLVRLCSLAEEITRSRATAAAESEFFSIPLSSADEDGENTIGTDTARGVYRDLLSDPAAEKRAAHG